MSYGIDKPRLIAYIIIYLLLFTVLLGYSKGSVIWGISEYNIKTGDFTDFIGINLSDISNIYNKYTYNAWIIDEDKLKAISDTRNYFDVDLHIVNIDDEIIKNYQYSTTINLTNLTTTKLIIANQKKIETDYLFYWELNKEDELLYFKKECWEYPSINLFGIVIWKSPIPVYTTTVIDSFYYDFSKEYYFINLSTSLYDVKDKNFVQLTSNFNDISISIAETYLTYDKDKDFFEFGIDTKKGLEIESLTGLEPKIVNPSIWDITSITLQIITFTAPSVISLPPFAVLLLFYIPSIMAIVLTIEVIRGI